MSNKFLNFKYKSIVTIAISGCIILSACQNGEEKQRQCAEDLQTFVHNTKDSLDQYADHSWASLDSQFNAKKASLEKDTGKMAQDLKDSYYSSLREWNTVKVDYDSRQTQKDKIAAADKLRATLAIDGVRPEYTDLSSHDLLREYEHFVGTVKANKDIYTKEDWTVININWKALNGRKRELEKDIPANVSSKINKLQFEYTGIKALNRPEARDES
jgi:hypothetical protein